MEGSAISIRVVLHGQYIIDLYKNQEFDNIVERELL